ncbi:hypothetical protein IRJ41_006423 [Triplophysa rosa]|uniref:Uncharacterized protein n=1 Tax=Triplophysa rosa TaxID=992332 RepID=A0A9W7TW20_TRIRA|nr:hypothetical protein IRJ41_006423 [Triplophysa rosa]
MQLRVLMYLKLISCFTGQYEGKYILKLLEMTPSENTNMDDKDADLFSFRTKPSSAPVQRKEEVKEEPYIVPDKSKTLGK